MSIFCMNVNFVLIKWELNRPRVAHDRWINDDGFEIIYHYKKLDSENTPTHVRIQQCHADR